MSKLTIMMGIPGSGKSTWARANKKENDVIVSRDEIRFGLLKEGEEYFAHENQVISTFLTDIRIALSEGHNVFADATHLTKKVRARVIEYVKGFADEIECVWIDAPLEIAFKQNDKRQGLAWVKHGIIRRMAFSIEEPEESEGFDKITVVIV